jgi:AhpD family alkylhydroperoxidase
MSTRLKLKEQDLPGYRQLVAMEQHLATTGLTQAHKDLIYIRASQINGCSYCIDKHSVDAREHGETERRIYALNAWRETPFFTPEERAILALTEEMTLIAQNHVTDATYDQAAAILGDKYLSSVIMCIISINAWNRLGISTGILPSDR